MENAENNGTYEGLNPLIQQFFADLKENPNFPKLLEQPYADASAQVDLMNYLNMDVIENYLLKLKHADLATVDTFMSNGLEWVNGTVARYQHGLKDNNVKELIHLYVNLLALLAGAPTVFMKAGAIMMYSMAIATVNAWL